MPDKISVESGDEDNTGDAEEHSSLDSGDEDNASDAEESSVGGEDMDCDKKASVKGDDEVNMEGEQEQNDAYAGTRKRKHTEKFADYQKYRIKKQKKRPMGISVVQVSEKGIVPKCKYCRNNIEPRGKWHMVKVAPYITGSPQQWRNESHYHFKCSKSALEYRKAEILQLLAIVRGENKIAGPGEKEAIIMAINHGNNE